MWNQLGSAGIALYFCKSYHVCSFWFFELQQYSCQLVLLDCLHMHAALRRCRVVCFVTEIDHYLYGEGNYNLYNESKEGSLY